MHQNPKRTPWQAVFVCWGRKYNVSDINRLISAIRQHCPSVCRFVLLSDRERPGLDKETQVRFMPERYLAPDMTTSGCQAKLSIFEQGILDQDMPAIFFDLDTAVWGDIGQLIEHRDTDETVMILKSANLTFSKFSTFLWRITKGRHYARGNSSFIVFHPKFSTDIASEFWRLYQKHGGINFRPMIADERFISWVKQPVMKAIPHEIAVKFPTEFMMPGKFLSWIKPKLPWVRRRRENLVALTYCDDICKPTKLLAMQDGQVSVDHKSRILIWDEKSLGSIKAKTIQYFS